MASFSVFCISHFLIGQARQHLCQAIDALFELLAHHLADEEVEVGLDGQAHSALVIVLRKQLNPHVCCHGHPFGSELDGLLRLALYDAERGSSYRGVARNAVPVELQLAELLDNLLELFRLHLVAGLLLDALHRFRIIEPLLDDSQIVEVCQSFIDASNGSVYLLYFAFVFSHLVFTI